MQKIHQAPVFIIDDEADIRAAISQFLMLQNIAVTEFSDANQLLESIDRRWPGVIISDINMPNTSGIELLQKVQQLDADIPVILLTGYGDVQLAVECMQKGAYDFLEKPFDNEQLLEAIVRAGEKRALTLENRNLKQEIASQTQPGPRILGKTPQMSQLRQTLNQILDAPADVMIFGETGCGKELVARYLHDHSPRADHNFVAINCGAVPETIIESELFGAEAGAYTGADKKRIGKFEYANGGTLFLDEIESTPMSLQVKLLRVLEDRQVVRLGSNTPIDLDIRIIAATKVDLLALADQGQFRHDLYYRLNLVNVNIPPLRERMSDVPLLFMHFARIASARYHRESIPLSPEHNNLLMSHNWPGNVRELRNMAERYVLLGPQIAFGQNQQNSESLTTQMGLTERVEFFEKTLIEDALSANHGSIKNTMQTLNLARKTLYDKMKKYQITRDDFLE